MKKLSGITLLALLLGLSGTGSGLSAAFTPTTCPTNYSCSVTAAGTRPLTGQANDGHPSSIIGVLSFDATSKLSGFLAINNNGTVSTFDLSGATCVSGTGGNLGQIDFTTATGHPLVFDFVTYATGVGGDGMLIADATPNATNGTEVVIGDCRPAAAVPTK